MTVQPKPFATIVIPALNEEKYIADCIRSLLPDQGRIDCEILVLDGGSVDRTPAIVEQMAREHSGIRLIRNERRLQAAALNKAAHVAASQSEIIIRADAHALYPAGFVESVVDAMVKTGASSVVVPMRAVGLTCFQKAAAAAQNSRLGNGGAAHRTGAESGFVEHGHHAAFKRRDFIALGGYDESFTHNEDAEYDFRLIGAGGRIWMQNSAAITYFPRTTIASLARQYFNHGRGRAKTVLKHRTPFKPRQLLPVAALAGCATSLALSIMSPLFLTPAVIYAGACVGWGVVLGAKEKDGCAMSSGVAAMTMHLSWACGLIATFARGDFRRERSKEALLRN